MEIRWRWGGARWPTRTVADARAMYVKLAMEHQQGMASPYTSGIMFQTMPNAADPDTTAKMPEMWSK